MSDLRLNLYENAMDSIRHAIEHYANDPDDTRKYKYAILHFAQGVALLLKQRLSQEHPNFIYKDVAKPDGQTIDVKTSIERLKEIASVDMERLEDAILELSALRNTIEHYAVTISKQQADNIIGRFVPLLAAFVSTELGRQLQYEVGAEAWNSLLAIQSYRANAIANVKSRIASENLQAFYCDDCQDLTAVAKHDDFLTNDSIRKIACLACERVYYIVPQCRECGKDLNIRTLDSAGVRYHTYCEECQTKILLEFPGYDFPDYLLEVRRWFRENEYAEYSDLDSMVLNVSTFGPSGRPGKIHKLIDYGVVDFVDPFDRVKYEALMNSSDPRRYFSEMPHGAHYKWVGKRNNVSQA